MNDERENRIDLSPLDPTADPARFDRIVGSIVSGAASALQRRRTQNNVVGEISRWRRPMLAAAAAAAILSFVTLQTLPTAEQDFESTGTIAEAVGVPSHLAEWVDQERLPTAGELTFGY